jgi:hypothetical protein
MCLRQGTGSERLGDVAVGKGLGEWEGRVGWRIPAEKYNIIYWRANRAPRGNLSDAEQVAACHGDALGHCFRYAWCWS